MSGASEVGCGDKDMNGQLPQRRPTVNHHDQYNIISRKCKYLILKKEIFLVTMFFYLNTIE